MEWKAGWEGRDDDDGQNNVVVSCFLLLRGWLRASDGKKRRNTEKNEGNEKKERTTHVPEEAKSGRCYFCFKRSRLGESQGLRHVGYSTILKPDKNCVS